VVGQAEAAAAEDLLKRMSAAKVNSIFTHLRKLAQHPLLVRSTYTDAKVAELARLAHQKCAPDGDEVSLAPGSAVDSQDHRQILEHGSALIGVPFSKPSVDNFCADRLHCRCKFAG